MVKIDTSSISNSCLVGNFTYLFFNQPESIPHLSQLKRIKNIDATTRVFFRKRLCAGKNLKSEIPQDTKKKGERESTVREGNGYDYLESKPPRVSYIMRPLNSLNRVL